MKAWCCFNYEKQISQVVYMYVICLIKQNKEKWTMSRMMWLEIFKRDCIPQANKV